MKLSPEIFGGLITGRAPVYSADGKFLFCPTDFVIKVFSTRTGLLVQKLIGHTSRVSSVFLHTNPLQIFSTATDGTIRLWDYLDGVELESLAVGEPLTFFYVLSGPHHCQGVYATPSKTLSKLKYYHLTIGADRKLTKQFLVKSARPNATALHSSGKYLALAVDKSLLMVQLADNSTQSYTSDCTLTALDFHPTTYDLASGDTSGRLKIWHCERGGRLVEPEEAKVSPHHWHQAKIRAVRYSPDGYYIHTGGKEGVLVSWQLRAGRRDFLPRLGAPLAVITVSSKTQQICVGLVNGTFLLFGGMSREREAMISGLISPAASFLRRGLPACAVLDPRSRALVLNSREGWLQFYNPFSETVEAEVEVSPVNTPATHQRRANAVQIDCVCFSADGSVMVTAETLETEKDVHFWSSTLRIFDYADSAYCLHTLSDDPHRGLISGLDYHPSRDLFVTSSHDKTFKLWARTTDAEKRQRWGLKSTGTFKMLPAGACRFSADGTLLAVTFGGFLTLWDPASNSLVRTLASTQPRDLLRFVEFLPGSTHIAAASKTALHVWDLRSCSLLWSYADLNIVRLAVDPLQPRLALSCTEDDRKASHLFLFDADQPSPRYSWKFPGAVLPVFLLSHPPQRHRLASLFPGLDPGRRSSLACVDTKFRVYNLELEPWPREAHRPALDAPTSIFTEVFGSDLAVTSTSEVQADTGAKPTNALFSAATHALPSVDVLFPLFVASLLDKTRPPAPPSAPLLPAGATAEDAMPGVEEPAATATATDTELPDSFLAQFTEFFRENKSNNGTSNGSSKPAKPKPKGQKKATVVEVESSQQEDDADKADKTEKAATVKNPLRKSKEAKSAPSTPQQAEPVKVPASAPARPKRKIDKT